MKELNVLYWQNRYQEHKTGWDLGKISTPIKEYIDQLINRDLKILIPGAGNAYEAKYLFRKKFKQIDILDFAKIPLTNIQQQLPDFPNKQLINKNFFEHSGSYELIIEQTFFCALEPRFRESYAKKTHELLKDGGYIIGVLFNFTDKKNGPPYGGSTREYRELFSPYFDILIMENCYNSVTSREGKELFIKLQKRTNGN